MLICVHYNKSQTMKLCCRDQLFQSNVCNFQGFSGVISNEGDKYSQSLQILTLRGPQEVSVFVFCILFLLHPIDNTLVQCTILISTRLFKLRVHEKKKLEWRRAHYSKTNHGPLTRLTLNQPASKDTAIIIADCVCIKWVMLLKSKIPFIRINQTYVMTD